MGTLGNQFKSHLVVNKHLLTKHAAALLTQSEAVLLTKNAATLLTEGAAASLITSAACSAINQLTFVPESSCL